MTGATEVEGEQVVNLKTCSPAIRPCPRVTTPIARFSLPIELLLTSGMSLPQRP
jgi:hypothetical protein